jgi:hypothetical protein
VEYYLDEELRRLYRVVGYAFQSGWRYFLALFPEHSGI